MRDFRREYRRVFRAVGRPLGAGDRRSKNVLEKAGLRLGVRPPKALQDYYLVAGRERRFNLALNRLLPPNEWFLEAGKLVFMKGYQGGVLFGTDAKRDPAHDPTVFRGFDDDPVVWTREHQHCSAFLGWMVLWQATVGRAMPFFGTSAATRDTMERLDRNWSLYSVHNRVRAYSRRGRAACFLNWKGGVRVFVGVNAKRTLAEVARELAVNWERSGETATKTSGEWGVWRGRDGGAV